MLYYHIISSTRTFEVALLGSNIQADRARKRGYFFRYRVVLENLVIILNEIRVTWIWKKEDV